MEKKKIVKCVIDEDGKLGITAMGLVDKPAIEENWIFLNEVKLQSLDEERRMIYGPALIPNKHILRVDDSGQEYYIFFDEKTVQKVAHQFFLKNLHHTTNLQHQTPVAGVTVVESWVKEGDSDKSIALGLSDKIPVGTWFIGSHVEDDAVWAEVKAGNVRGYSIEGLFSEVALSLSQTSEELFLKELEDLLNIAAS